MTEQGASLVRHLRLQIFRLTHNLRTEGPGAWREAAGIGLGLLIGLSPFYGLHLLLTWIIGRTLGLNRLKIYGAANVSNPLTAPLIVFVELQTGAWLRWGHFHPVSIQTLRQTSVWSFGTDVVLGWVAIGGAAALAGAGLTRLVRKNRGLDPWFDDLAAKVAARYAEHSSVAAEFARGKLRGDPVYRHVIEQSLLPRAGTLLDIGCGQGLMLALLLEARRSVRDGRWPTTRPLPPRFDRLMGIDVRPRVVALANAALGDAAEIARADVCHCTLPPATAIMIFDVLHMLLPEQQDCLLSNIRSALEPAGVVLVREADPGAGWRFHLVRTVNRTKALLGGSWHQSFHFRRPGQWTKHFASFGFHVTLCAAPPHNALGNVLFRLSPSDPASKSPDL